LRRPQPRGARASSRRSSSARSRPSRPTSARSAASAADAAGASAAPPGAPAASQPTSVNGGWPAPAGAGGPAGGGPGPGRPGAGASARCRPARKRRRCSAKASLRGARRARSAGARVASGRACAPAPRPGRARIAGHADRAGLTADLFWTLRPLCNRSGAERPSAPRSSAATPERAADPGAFSFPAGHGQAQRPASVSAACLIASVHTLACCPLQLRCREAGAAPLRLR